MVYIDFRDKNILIMHRSLVLEISEPHKTRWFMKPHLGEFWLEMCIGWIHIGIDRFSNE